MARENLPMPQAMALQELSAKPEYTGGVWMLDIDASGIDQSPQRVNISMPRSLLTEIDR